MAEENDTGSTLSKMITILFCKIPFFLLKVNESAALNRIDIP
jgi:hypothetical protein